MVTALTAGVILGLSAGFAPGPLLTLVITQTLRHNTREGMITAGAPVLTDVPIVLLAFFLFRELSSIENLLGMIAVMGAMYVLYLSWETFKIGPVSIDLSQAPAHSLRKGMLINLLNPHPYLFWVTVGAPYTLQLYERHTHAPWVFIGAFYVFLIGSKILLAVIVGRFRSFLGGTVYRMIMRGLGVLLAGFALLIFRDALKLLGLIAC